MGRSSYPNELDTDLELPRVDNNVTEIGGDSINALRDAILAIETAVGVSPQGNKVSLAERVATSIDSNGNIKSSALESNGLVSLPIFNSHISSVAGIEESKLNLDHSTVFLKGRSDSNAVDIAAANLAFNSFVSDTLKHFGGVLNRHDGYQIDLTTTVRGTTNVESALNTINNEFTEHEGLTTNAHTASSISVVDNFTKISAVEVQDALVKLDALDTGVVEHQDRLHDSSITLNNRGEQGKQGNLLNTTLASTIFQTDTTLSTNILQVMRPNVSRVTSSGAIDLAALSFGVKDSLRIQAGGMSRGVIDIDLGTIIPTDNLDDVVQAINTQARLDHYPIAAYNIEGSLTIAHNLQGAAYTIQILDTISKSAHDILGFADVTSTVFTWSDGYHAAYIGGNKVTDMKPLLKITYNHSSGPKDEISPQIGNLLTFFDVPTTNEAKILANITNHSADDAYNGTYYITNILGSGNVSFRVNALIPFGEFDLDISNDSLNFDTSASGQIFDVFLEFANEDGYDGYGLVKKSLRAEYLTIAGVSIRTVSKNFPTSSVEWEVTGNDTLQLLEGGVAGVPVAIPNGFRGQLEAFMPDNVNSALFEVTGNPSSSKKVITPINEFDGTDDKIYLSSIHYAGDFGTSVLKFVTDKRQLGASKETKFTDVLDSKIVDKALSGLRNNGVIYGFEVLSNTSTTIKVRGGRALVSGKLLDVDTKDVTIDSFTGANRLLTLDHNGFYKSFDTDEAGFSLSELTSGDSYGDNRNLAIIAEFGTTSSILSGTFSDKRLLIGNIDKRLLDKEAELNNRIDQLENSVNGTLWGFTETATTDASGSFVASIKLTSNVGFAHLDEAGFSGTATTRRYEFTTPDAYQESIFKAVGLTHLNIMLQANYTGEGGGEFGTSGNVNVDVGLQVTTGIANGTVVENYVTVKNINTTVLPSANIAEQYIVSIPTTLVSLENNEIFDVTPRIRIVGATFVDGGVSGDTLPVIEFGKIRVVTSSYSVAGNILGEDGTNVALSTTVGDVL